MVFFQKITIFHAHRVQSHHKGAAGHDTVLKYLHGCYHASEIACTANKDKTSKGTCFDSRFVCKYVCAPREKRWHMFSIGAYMYQKIYINIYVSNYPYVSPSTYAFIYKDMIIILYIYQIYMLYSNPKETHINILKGSKFKEWMA